MDAGLARFARSPEADLKSRALCARSGAPGRGLRLLVWTPGSLAWLVRPKLI